MKLKGLQELREHVPDLRSPLQSALIWELLIGIFSITTILFIKVNRIIPIWAPDGQIIVLTIGFLLMRMFFMKKKVYKFRDGDLAYRNAFGRFALPGLALIFSIVGYTGYMPGPQIPISWWKVVTPILGWYFVLIGATLWLRAIFTFGLDNLAVHFPKKGCQVDNSIYSVLQTSSRFWGTATRPGIGLPEWQYLRHQLWVADPAL